MPIISLNFHNILFYFITFLWIIEFIVFKPLYKRLNYSEMQSFKTIFVVIITIILGTISYNLFNLFIMPNYTFIYFNYIGIFLYIIGIFLRYYASYTQSKYFARDIDVTKNQILISEGPYRLFAHPLYLGLFILVLAVPVYFGQIIWIFGALLFFGKVILNRMKTEEKELEESLNETYTMWLKKRYRFIPWIF